MITNRRRLLGLELEAERVLAGLLVDALPMGEQLNDLSTPVVDQKLVPTPRAQGCGHSSAGGRHARAVASTAGPAYHARSFCLLPTQDNLPC